MKLSNETLSILKNFSTINSSILVKKGSVLSTMSPNKTVLAKAQIADEFPQEFAIYDLNNFLTLTSLDKNDTELDFDQHHVLIKSLGGRSKIYYRFTDKNMIVTPPEKAINFGKPDYTFNISMSDLEWIKKIVNLLDSPNISFEGDGTNLNVVAFDIKNDAANKNSLTIGETDKEFKAVFKSEHFKLIEDSYTVEISAKGISHFVNESDTLQYWIPLEKDGNVL